MAKESYAVLDKRLDDSVAIVDIYGKVASIREHYQSAKLFIAEDLLGNVSLRSFDDEDKVRQEERFGNDPVRFKVLDESYPAEYLPAFYKLLWIAYLDSRPRLVEFAKLHPFRKRRTVDGLPDVPNMYASIGRSALIDECEPLSSMIWDALPGRNYDVYLDVSHDWIEDPPETITFPVFARNSEEAMEKAKLEIKQGLHDDLISGRHYALYQIVDDDHQELA